MNPTLFPSHQHQVKEADHPIPIDALTSPPSPLLPPVFTSSSVPPTAENPKRIAMRFQTVSPETRHQPMSKSQRKVLRRYYAAVPRPPPPDWRIYDTYTDRVHPSYPETSSAPRRRHHLSPPPRSNSTSSSSRARRARSPYTTWRGESPPEREPVRRKPASAYCHPRKNSPLNQERHKEAELPKFKKRSLRAYQEAYIETYNHSIVRRDIVCANQDGAFLNELQQDTLQSLDQEDFNAALALRFSPHEMAVHFPYQCPPGCTRRHIQFSRPAGHSVPHATSSVYLNQIAFNDQPLFFARDVALKEDLLTAGTLARHLHIAKSCIRYHTCPHLNQPDRMPPSDPAAKEFRPPEDLSLRQKSSEKEEATCDPGPNPVPMGVCDDTPRDEKLCPDTSSPHPGVLGRHQLPDVPPTYHSSIKHTQPKPPTAAERHHH